MTPQAQMRHTIRTRTSGAVTCIGFVSAMWCLRIMAFPFVCAASLTYQGTSDTHTAACKNRDLLSSGVPKHITGISRFRPRPSLSAHLLAMSDVDSSERNEQPCDLLPSARHSASTNCDTSCELQNTNWSGEMLTVHVDFAFFDNLSHHLTTMLVIPFPSRQIPRVWNLFIYYGTFGYWKYRAPTPLSLLPYLLSPGCHATALCQVEESVKSVDSVKAMRGCHVLRASTMVRPPGRLATQTTRVTFAIHSSVQRSSPFHHRLVVHIPLADYRFRTSHTAVRKLRQSGYNICTQDTHAKCTSVY
jgi:hypothetical protein